MQQKLSEIVKQILVSPTEELILKRCGTAEDEEESTTESSRLDEIKLIYLPYFHIRNLGQISSCRFLTICILRNNFLSSFDQLSNCPLLIKLDLHGNQLSTVPDASFWKNMKSLKVLNLHDNGLHKYDEIFSISNCQSLVCLTLYDTPLCLKQHYRHQVVNSIWTLKALDNHVISDCEVIEDIRPLPHFKPLNPRLQINLCPKLDISNQNNMARVEMEVKSVKSLMKEINKILAHCSPVLIIQRWFRGHMVRTSNKRKLPRRANDFVRSKFVGGNNDFDRFIFGSPGDGLKQQAHDKKKELIKIRLPKLQAANPPPKTSPKNRVVENRPTNLRKELLQHQHHQSGMSRNIFAADFKPNSNLALLQRIFQEENTKKSPPTVGKNNKEREEGSDKIETTQQDIQNEKFILRSTQPPVNMKHPVSEMIFSNQQAGRDIRAAVEEIHLKTLLDNLPPKILKHHQKRRPMSDGMSMAVLMAVTRAYSDREKEDKQIHRVQKVMRIQDEHKQEEQIIAAFHNERREKVSKQRIKDDLEMQQSLEKQKKERKSYLELARYRKEASLARHRQKHNDLLFVSDFINQHTSVSKALVKHDQQMKKKEENRLRNITVENIRKERNEKRTLFSQYMEQKKLGVQLNTLGAHESHIAHNYALRTLNKKRVVDCIKGDRQMQPIRKLVNPRSTPAEVSHPV